MALLKIKSRQWLVDDKDRIIMGEGRKEILENIDKMGSMNKAAKLMKMSYKGLWSKIKATEEYLNIRIVETDRKKGTRLTREGRELLKKYKFLKEKCVQADNKIFDGIFRQGRFHERGGKK